MEKWLIYIWLQPLTADYTRTIKYFKCMTRFYNYYGKRFHVYCSKLICMLKALVTLCLAREDFDPTHRRIQNWLLSSADQANPNKTIH